MRRLGWCAPCLCGFWLFISGCGGSAGRKPQPLIITSAVLPQAGLKQAYAGNTGFSVTAQGGVPPYHWTWAAAPGSTLPPGLKLPSNPDGTGTISGTSTNTGPYVVIVTVTDSESPARQESETYIITVATSALHFHTVTLAFAQVGPISGICNSGLQLSFHNWSDR
jgi:hypothetical protein